MTNPHIAINSQHRIFPYPAEDCIRRNSIVICLKIFNPVLPSDETDLGSSNNSTGSF